MAKQPGARKRGAARPKARRAKGLKDLEPAAKGKSVKGGVVCIPLIAIIIPPLPCIPVHEPPKPKR
jgi:hypothetical protein